MTRSVRALLVGGALAVLAAGCASGYYDRDGYYHHTYYRDGYYGDRTYRDRDDRNGRERVRICDPDGDDCHWEYR